MPGLSLIEESRRVRYLRARKDILYRRHKEAEKVYQEAHQKLLQRYKDEGCEGLKVDNVNFVPTTTRFGGIEDREAFLEWARKEQPELIEEKEVKGLLNEIVRECDDDGRALPPGLVMYTKEYISQTAG